MITVAKSHTHTPEISGEGSNGQMRSKNNNKIEQTKYEENKWNEDKLSKHAKI